MIITNQFGTKHPKTGTHEGVDFVTDDKIIRYPFYRGRVLYVGYEVTGLGKYVVFRFVDKDSKTKMVLMGHFEDIFVQKDDLVFKGTKIGFMGDTGFATGPHCHLELHAPIDPIPQMEDT